MKRENKKTKIKEHYHSYILKTQFYITDYAKFRPQMVISPKISFI